MEARVVALGDHVPPGTTQAYVYRLYAVGCHDLLDVLVDELRAAVGPDALVLGMLTIMATR